MYKRIVRKITVSLKRFFDPFVFIDHELKRYSAKDQMFGESRGTPIDRYYIEKFLSRKTNLEGDLRVLEVGDINYSKKYFPNATHVTLEYKKGSKGYIVERKLLLDLSSELLSIEEEYDVIIVSQTLNFIFNVQQAANNLKKLLRPGGQILITSGFISQLSIYDYDRWGEYWRLTDKALENLFSSASVTVTTGQYGNLSAALLFLQCYSAEDLEKFSLLEPNEKCYPVIYTAVIKKNE